MAQACSRSPDGGKPLREFAVKALYSRFRGNDDKNHMTTEASHVELSPTRDSLPQPASGRGSRTALTGAGNKGVGKIFS